MVLQRLKPLLIVSFLSIFLLNATPLFANEKEAAAKEEGSFNVTQTILEHIKDDHSWHLWGHTSISLPVILYTPAGFEVFSSAKLIDEHHEPAVYKGNFNYKLVEGKAKIVNAAGEVDVEASKKLWDFSITKNVASLFISVIVLLLVILTAAGAYKKTGITSAPKGLQSFMEPIVLFVRDEIALPNIGAKRYAKYMPFLLTIFFLILTNNFLGLIPIFPGGANVSGNIAFTMTLAVCVFIVVNLSSNKNYWEHIFWMPGVPVPMKIILAPIEVLGLFTKPFSLTIRLFANITAGHFVLMSLIALMITMKAMFGPVGSTGVSFLLTSFIMVIELLVAFLQAFIFTMLSSLFIGMAVEDHDHH